MHNVIIMVTMLFIWFGSCSLLLQRQRHVYCHGNRLLATLVELVATSFLGVQIEFVRKLIASNIL